MRWIFALAAILCVVGLLPLNVLVVPLLMAIIFSLVQNLRRKLALAGPSSKLTLAGPTHPPMKKAIT